MSWWTRPRLDSKDPAMRARAAAALAGSEDPQDFQRLIDALRDEDHNVRTAAATALGVVGDARAVDPLAETLNTRQDFFDYAEKQALIEALRKIGSPAAADVLAERLDGDDDILRMHAGDALGSMGGQGLDAILRVSRRSDITTSCRAEVARVISGIPDPRAAMELALLRNDPSEYVRGAAQQHAGNMPPELQEAAEVKCGWLSTLMLCMRKDVLGSDKQALREQAAEGVGREGEDGARMLARLIEDLLHSRSGEIASALLIARAADPVPELLDAVRAVQRASPLRPGKWGRFEPEITDMRSVAWADGTARRVQEIASETLAVLSPA
ncbi:MAG TPA: HEAT repeat domain-containing protein [Gemmatimonadota bacterium]|jgi:hypothetical protein